MAWPCWQINAIHKDCSCFVRLLQEHGQYAKATGRQRDCLEQRMRSPVHEGARVYAFDVVDRMFQQLIVFLFIGSGTWCWRAALIAWLRTLADSPPALPSEADIAAEQAELAPAPETPAGDEPAETQNGDTAAQATGDENSADAPADQPAAQ